MKEGDVEAFGTATGSFVDEAAAFFFGFGEGVSHAVFHGEGNVLYAATAAVCSDELADCAVVGSSFEELNLDPPTRKNAVRTFPVGHFFDGEAFEARMFS